MTKNLFYESNEKEWELESRLKEKGYIKTADCFWAQIFVCGNKKIILNRK